MRASIHLTFAGECATAFRFYERALGAKIVSLLTYGETAMAGQVPPEWRGKIVHASLKLGDLTLAGADVLAQQYQRPQGFYVLIEVPSLGEAERVFQALAEKGAEMIAMPAAFTMQTGKDHWEVLLRARAIETETYVCASAQTGSFSVGNESRQTYGHSLVADPWGHVIAKASDGVGIVSARIEPMRVKKVRAMIPVAQHKVKIARG